MYRGSRTFIHIDIDPTQLGRVSTPDLGLVADAGRRVTEPGDIKAALALAVKTSNEKRVPVLIEVRVDRETDAAMGNRLDKITERDPVVDLMTPREVGAK